MKNILLFLLLITMASVVVFAQAQNAPAAPKGAVPEAVAASGAATTDASRPAAGTSDLEKDLAAAAGNAEPASEDFVVARESVSESPAKAKTPKVIYNPQSKRDPTLSPDDILLLQHREQQRLAALEAERQRKLAEERRRREEAERLRQLELARIKDPTREVRNKIKIGGIIGQEVFIGNKIYTIGNSIYGARIVAVNGDDVVFSYKGHKFVRTVQL
ncbi:MAG: hypothetical protein IKO35_02555 [Elusimicrobiaceae bacterium]|nr:hypothetical protein [Elusimicrobiaceae bacterium]